MTDQKKLKPCPFCGCENVKLESDHQNQVSFVACPSTYKGGCGAQGGYGSNDRALERWNRRTEK